MLFSLILVVVAGASSFVSAFPSSIATFSDEFVVREDGNVASLFQRDGSGIFSLSEIMERDNVISDLEGRSDATLSVQDIEEIAARYIMESEVLQRRSIELEGRSPAIIVRGIAQGIKAIVKGIKAGIAKDKARRGDFTTDFVKQAVQKNPEFNWVICHTKHTKSFDGKEGTDWGHDHQEFDVKIGGTVGYEIYWFRSGTFTNKGDGGFLNWAYRGKVIAQKGKTITFGRK